MVYPPKTWKWSEKRAGDVSNGCPVFPDKFVANWSILMDSVLFQGGYVKCPIQCPEKGLRKGSKQNQGMTVERRGGQCDLTGMRLESSILSCILDFWPFALGGFKNKEANATASSWNHLALIDDDLVGPRHPRLPQVDSCREPRRLRGTRTLIENRYC
jgi:hypothetical protein